MDLEWQPSIAAVFKVSRIFKFWRNSKGFNCDCEVYANNFLQQLPKVIKLLRVKEMRYYFLEIWNPSLTTIFKALALGITIFFPWISFLILCSVHSFPLRGSNR